MIRFFSLLACLALLFSFPAFAQEDADAVLAEDKLAVSAPADDHDTRLELSRKMHEIWPIRPKVEAALDNISEQIPETERLKFKSGMRKAIKFEALEEASVEAMADIFTVKELEAMIVFYGSKEGRSVSHKTGDYEKALRPVLTEMVDKALLDIKLGSQ